MFDLTVDTYVLVIASGLSDQKAKECHVKLLHHFKTDQNLVLALDEEGHIESEYHERLRHGDWGKQWLMELAKQERIKPCKRGHLNKGVQVALQEAHFDTGDYKFVRVAMVTKSKRLVAEEDDYAASVCTILRKRLSVKVCDTKSICGIIDANLADEKPV